MEFLSCDESMLPEEVVSSFKFGPLTAKPRFLIFVGGEKKDEVNGADLTELERIIQRNMPSGDD